MPLDPEARALLDARAAVLPRTGTVSAQEMRALHKALLAKLPPPPPIYQVSDTVCPGPAGDIPLRVYRPGPQPRALIVYFHGGGYTVGSLDGWDAALRKLSSASGCAIASVDYRLAPEDRFPAAVDDALAAMRWAGDNVRSLAGREVPLVAAGDSAGGSLATVVCRVMRDDGGPAIAAQVLIYPGADGNIDSEFIFRFVPPSLTREEIAWYFNQYMPDKSQRGDPRFAPLHVEDLSGLPPAFVLTAENDLLLEEAELYAQRLRDCGLKVTDKRYVGTFHGFFTADRGLLPHSAEATKDLSEFLSGILNDLELR